MRASDASLRFSLSHWHLMLLRQAKEGQVISGTRMQLQSPSVTRSLERSGKASHTRRSERRSREQDEKGRTRDSDADLSSHNGGSHLSHTVDRR